MADIFEKLVKHNGPIGQHRERAHGYFAFPKLEGEIGSRMIFRGKEKIVWSQIGRASCRERVFALV